MGPGVGGGGGLHHHHKQNQISAQMFVTIEKRSLSEDRDLGIFECRLGKKDTFCHWEQGPYSAPNMTNESPVKLKPINQYLNWI